MSDQLNNNSTVSKQTANLVQSGKRQIPVTVITGFLGAGKTTLLSNLLSHCPDHEIAILVNEFGQTSIDGAIMERRSGDQPVEIHQVNNGLIAYSDDKQFMPAMLAIMNRQKPIDNVLVETSGLALPTAVMASLAQPELEERFQLDAVLAVVDTEIFLSGGFDEVAENPTPQNVLFDSRRSLASLFKQQLESADVVILNKVDKLKEEELILCELKIRKLAPRIRFVEAAYHAHLNPRIALGLHLHEATHLNSGLKQHRSAANNSARQTAQTVSHSLVNGHSHSGIGAHEHGLHTHEHIHEQDPAWLSFVLNTDEALDADSIKVACEAIARTQPVLRLKGFFKAQGSDNYVLVQGVRDKINCAPQEILSQADAERVTSQIVFIGYHLVREKVKDALTIMTAVNWY
jgi:cobalamin biosynthesis protein CobW